MRVLLRLLRRRHARRLCVRQRVHRQQSAESVCALKVARRSVIVRPLLHRGIAAQRLHQLADIARRVAPVHAVVAARVGVQVVARQRAHGDVTVRQLTQTVPGVFQLAAQNRAVPQVQQKPVRAGFRRVALPFVSVVGVVRVARIQVFQLFVKVCLRIKSFFMGHRVCDHHPVPDFHLSAQLGLVVSLPVVVLKRRQLRVPLSLRHARKLGKPAQSQRLRLPQQLLAFGRVPRIRLYRQQFILLVDDGLNVVDLLAGQLAVLEGGCHRFSELLAQPLRLRYGVFVAVVQRVHDVRP